MINQRYSSYQRIENAGDVSLQRASKRCNALSSTRAINLYQGKQGKVFPLSKSNFAEAAKVPLFVPI